MNTFVRDDILPSWWANAIQKFISNLSSGFVVSQFDNTTIQVVAGPDDAAAIVSVHGRWRWNEATVQRAHPGGAAATYDIFVTASANDVTNVPDPNTDNTNYAFALAIVAHGATPAIVAGVVDIYRKVGELSWDGAKITAITQLVPTKAGPLAHALTHQPGGVDAIDFSTIHLRGTFAARPVASAANANLLYFATDAAGGTTYRSTGAAWEQTAMAVAPAAMAPAAHAATHAPGAADALDYTQVHLRGTLAARPAAAAANNGLLYYAYDITSASNLFRSTGAAWEAAGGGGGGITKVTAFPAAPAEADLVIRTDQSGDPTYKYVAGAWEQQPRMGAVNVPTARVRTTVAQSIPANVDAVLTFNTEDYDTDSIHDPVTNNTRLVAHTPGRYRVLASAVLTGGSGGVIPVGVIEARLRVTPASGGAAFNIARARKAFNPSVDGGTTSSAPTIEVAGEWNFAAGDYVEVVVNQTSTASNSVQVIGSESPVCEMTWLGGAGQTVDERGVPAAAMYVSSDQSIPAGSVVTKIGFNSKSFDTDGMVDTTNSRLVAKTPGLYRFSVMLSLQAAAVGTGAPWVARLYKNGVRYRDFWTGAGNAVNASAAPSLEDVAAAGDYYEVFLVNTEAGTARSAFSSENGCRFETALIGSGKTVTPYARAYNSGSPSIPNDTVTSVALDSEIADNDGIHDTVTNTSHFVCNTAGVYSINGAIRFTANANGIRGAQIKVNGTAVAATTIFSAGGGVGTDVPVHADIELALGDYVELAAWQQSGGPLTLVGASSVTKLEMVKVGAPNVGTTGIDPVEAIHVVGGAGEPAFSSADWTNYDTLHFYKDRGRGYIGGTVRLAQGASGANGRVIFTLPVGYRPAVNQYLPVQSNNGGVGYWLEVTPAGSVAISDEGPAWPNNLTFNVFHCGGSWRLA